MRLSAGGVPGSSLVGFCDPGLLGSCAGLGSAASLGPVARGRWGPGRRGAIGRTPVSGPLGPRAVPWPTCRTSRAVSDGSRAELVSIMGTDGMFRQEFPMTHLYQ